MNLDPEINEAIEKAIAKHAKPGDTVDYTYGLTMAAGSEGQPVVVAVIVLRMNAATIGEHLTTGMFIDSPIPTFEQLDEPVGERIRALRMERSQQLVREAADEHGHGHGHGHSPDAPPRTLEIPGV